MKKSFAFGILAATVLVVPALAQSSPSTTAPAATPPAARTTAAPAANHVAVGSVWRATKLKGLNVYNDKNEKLGDVNEILIDKSGKVAGLVIGVGGFLGMGEHDIMVEMSKLKFVDEPVRTSSTSTTSTTGVANSRSSAATSTSNSDHKWYPDHAVLSGATKDTLKAMPQFKYE